MLKNPSQVGVLLLTSTLRRVVQGKATWESAREYAAAAEDLHIELLLFSLRGYSARRKSIRGYTWRKGSWRSWRGPLPLVVHNRLIPSTLGAHYLVRYLAKQLACGMFNSAEHRDRWDEWQHLAHGERIKGHVLPTYALTSRLCSEIPALLQEYGGVVIKPRDSRVESNKVSIQRGRGDSKCRWIPVKGRSRILSETALVRRLRRFRAQRAYIVQRSIAEATYKDQPFTMRVPVQRDGSGRWRVHSGTADLNHTNESHPYHVVLTETFGTSHAESIWDEIRNVSVAVAEGLSKRYEHVADLTIDIGIDREGNVWLHDQHFRDRRVSPKKAGQIETHKQLYHTPLAYAKYLVDHSEQT